MQALVITEVSWECGVIELPSNGPFARFAPSGDYIATVRDVAGRRATVHAHGPLGQQAAVGAALEKLMAMPEGVIGQTWKFGEDCSLQLLETSGVTL